MQNNDQECSFTITTRREQRLRLEAIKVMRAHRDGVIPRIKDLVGEAFDMYLAAEEQALAK